MYYRLLARYIGRDNRVIAAERVLHVLVSFPVVMPLPIDQIAVLVFAVGFQVKRDSEAALLLLHRRGVLVPVIEIAYEIHGLSAFNALRQFKGHFALCLQKLLLEHEYLPSWSVNAASPPLFYHSLFQHKVKKTLRPTDSKMHNRGSMQQSEQAAVQPCFSLSNVALLNLSSSHSAASQRMVAASNPLAVWASILRTNPTFASFMAVNCCNTRSSSRPIWLNTCCGSSLTAP